jgi:phage terminase large subunit GpA-like protein
VHLSKHLPEDEIDQITAERLVTRYVKGRPRMEWTLPPGRRNEGLDCAVYALAAAHWVGIDRWKDGDWQRREEAVRVEQPEQKAGAKREHLVAAGVSRRISIDGMARFGDRPNAQR